ncbi:MAG: Mur ligase domain-containing protein [Patescibacteria group bacterium]|nr:Mur ligase domain-containing protein [Patescibacteria group bacterium]
MTINWKKAYLIGIKGSGMTALAKILKDLGITVIGSDVKDKFFTDEVLQKNKIKYYEGFDSKNLLKEMPVDVVISSVAYFQPDKKSKNNNEIRTAQKLKIPILTYPQALAQIFNQSFGIAICGSHGKSSTTAILGRVFQELNFDPTVLVGSEVIDWQSNSLTSKNFKDKLNFLRKNEKNLNNIKWLGKNFSKLPIFIIEADEYRESFLNYHPRIIIITNIDYDHPDYFKNAFQYRKSFYKFIANLQEPKILISYRQELKMNIVDMKVKKFLITFNQKNTLPFPIPGLHFQKNLQLIEKLIKIFKISEKKFRKALLKYRGIKRRFEIVKYKNNIYLIDDYAHHPTEVWSYFNSLKIAFPNYKIFFIFQPHTFTRTHFLFNNFKEVFSKIKNDKLTIPIIFKTFSSAREKSSLLKNRYLKREIDLAKELKIDYFNKQSNLINFLEKNIRPQTIITTVGAGDLYKILDIIKI